ncbi:MAG: LemA family protein [Bacteroidia bacterium]|nr:LemA family protein [Bacteroidia bacterium]
MNKGLIVAGGIGVFLLIILMNGCSTYNSMVEKNEDVTGKWQQVETQYQRRMDLIPNIVKTVEAYANFEKSTLVEVTNARATATSIKIDPSKLDAQSIANFEKAQGAVTGALSKLLVTFERYPDLKANQNFMALMTELEGTENRIAESRRDFNLSAQGYNTYIKKFPTNLWAGIFNFDARSYFESADGADKAPEVKFDMK